MRINKCLSNKMKYIVFIMPFFVFVFVFSKTYAYNSGNCFSIDDDTKRAIRIGNKISFVTKHHANIYRNEHTEAKDGHLDFNEKIWISGIGEKRVEIEIQTGKQKWINKADLLCSDKPLKTKGKEGLEKKFFVCSESIRTEKKFSVKAYPDPISDACNNLCKELRSFTSYFIFDENEKRYLLSLTYRLKNGKLLGWVDKKDGILWETSLGLRPSERLEYTPIFAYESIEDAKKKKNGFPILGGKRWFKWDQRIPIIDRRDSFYMVVIPQPTISCNKLGKNRAYDQLFKGVIPVDENIEVEVWCSASALDKYLRVLYGIINVNEFSTGNVLRKDLIHSIAETIERVLGEPFYENDMIIGEYLLRFGLPVRNHSPLFQYSLSDLKNKNKVSDCVVEALFLWITNIFNILEMVKENKYTTFETIFQKSCTDASHIPYIVPYSIKGGTFPDGMGYSNSSFKTTFYWIPEKYLP